ncbi:cytochrome P450 [Streptomyces sp. A7024]|uniref:Cytochrome P450 n=1 Tax=Streptomyces coryli TaxID=1128680 RepID=A0A6G4TS19_9ACTN|nr:cytochrome P450 [Streptomyces coryli]NGN62582.1 cytochrome P450 [Streptomyces coryli]
MTAPLAYRGVRAASAVTSRLPVRSRPLALPPPGSGLKPVPGDHGPPLVGHTFSLQVDSLRFSRRRYERYGPVAWSGVLGTRMVGVVGPEAIQTVAANRDRAFGNAGFYGYLIGAFFHRGLLLLDFAEHLHHRRIMQHAFTLPRLDGYLAAMNPRIEQGLERWRPGDRFPVYAAAKAMTLDIANAVFAGESASPRSAEAKRLTKAFVDAVHGGQAIVRADVPGGVWARGLRGRRYLETYFRSRLADKRDSKTDDLFSVLCRAESETGDAFGDDDIVNHMIFAMMAAHDTSTITLAMMAYYLGRNPEWQERVRAESEALGKDALDYDDLLRLPLLDLVFKETLRINAPVGGLFREAVKDTEILGYYIPKGTRVLASIYQTQRMEPWWRDPDVFDPERFAEERREDKSHRYVWSAFGGGAHKCIGLYFGGMEVKAIMHRMLLRYRWRVPGGYEPPLSYGTGPMPVDGLPLELRRLESA